MLLASKRLFLSYLKDGQQGHRSYQTGQRQDKKDERGNAAGLLPFPSWETGKFTTTLYTYKYSHNEMFQFCINIKEKAKTKKSVLSRDIVCDVTLDLVGLKNPEEPGRQEAELSLTGVRESCNHLRHGGLPSDAGQAVIISEQEPVRGK